MSNWRLPFTLQVKLEMLIENVLGFANRSWKEKSC